MKKLSYLTSIVLIIALSFSACKTQKKRNGKLKPGKPVPCPIYDC